MSLAPDLAAKAQAALNPQANAQQPESPHVHQVPRRSAFGSLLSRTLPDYSGTYSVGICDVEVPVPRQTFGTFRHKAMKDSAGTAGLVMDTVLFSLFYPCEPPEKVTPVMWFPNMRQTIDGFLKMAKRTPNNWYRSVAYPLAAAAIWGTTFPATKDAPLLKPPGENGKWPLMLFSHGVGCSRLMYSAFCGEMASRGYIVAVLEHRDGTSPSSKITSEDGTTKALDWLEWTDLEWPDLPQQPKDDTILRHSQIALRVAEVNETVAVLRRLSQGEDVRRYCDTKIDWGRWKWLDASKPVMTGHSLGGSVGLAIAAQKEIEFTSVVVFDPATQRLDPWTKSIPYPLLVVNSEEFAVGAEWKIFAEQIAGTVTGEDAPALVFSIPGATHPSFSDVFLILPEYVNKLTGLRIAANRVLELAVGATSDFLAGQGDAIIARSVKYVGGPKATKLVVAEGKNGELKEKEEEKESGQNAPELQTVPKPGRPVGKVGELVWHPFE